MPASEVKICAYKYIRCGIQGPFFIIPKISMTISPSQYLFAWQAFPVLLNAVHVFTSPGEWLHPATLAYENTIPVLHVSG